MRKPLLAVMAIALATMFAVADGGDAFMPRLIRLEAAAAVPEMANLLESEPVAVNAALLDYADDPALRLNAHLALLRYPHLARELLSIYGLEPEFQEVLSTYGPAVLPPIAYFMGHDITSLRLMHAAGEMLDGAKRTVLKLWDFAAGNDGAKVAGDDATVFWQPQPVDRGWYAIAFIREEGHDFLGQFVVDASGMVGWVQTERASEAATAFFTSGVRTLESRYRLGEEPEAADWLWAGVDVALAAGAVKALRIGRAAASTRAAGTSARGALAAHTLVRAGRIALRVGKYGLPVAVVYAVVRHPSLISGFAAQAAGLLGLPVALVQSVVWFLVLLPVLMLASWLARWVIKPTLFVLRAASRGLDALQRTIASDRTRARETAEPEYPPSTLDARHVRRPDA